MMRAFTWLVAITALAYTPRLHADLRVDAGYNAAADLFSLMDNVSLWSPGGFSKPEYREYWNTTYGWSSTDEQWASRYREYRERTYFDEGQSEPDPRTASDGLFAKLSSVSPQTDPLAEHFLAARSIDEALANLANAAEAEDAAMLAGFYEHFESKWQSLLEESAGFSDNAEALRSVLDSDGAHAYLERVSGFYRVDIDREFKAYFVWWPPIDRTAADISGRAFFIRSHPDRHAEEGGWESIIMHEVTHYVSAHQPKPQKRRLTDAFLGKCPVSYEDGYYELLEEPLAVAWGNAAFAKYGLNQPLNPDDNWYWRPMPALMGRLLWPHVDALYESGATIEDGLIDIAADYCQRLAYVAGKLRIASEP